MTYLRDQVAFGPRVPATPAAEACRDYFNRHFSDLGMELDSQMFTFYDPYSGRDIPLVNVIARYRCAEDNQPTLLLMAHWDSRPRTDYHSDTTLRHLPLDGANDGASGVALLMEVANLVSEKDPGCNIDFVLVDGEDWGKPGDTEYYLLGSKHFAKSSVRDQYEFGVVVDLVGDSDQRFLREGFSERYFPELNDMFWAVADTLDVTTFYDSTTTQIFDDHLSVGAVGVPTIAIIDFEYDHWHKETDTPENCSAEALANAGRVLTYVVYNQSVWPDL
jgi:Zn-dependent M28 family amino/carboxypeptidase